MKKLILISMSIIFMVIFQGCSSTPSIPLNGEQVGSQFDDWTIPSPTEDTAVIYGEIHSSNETPVGNSVFLALNLTYDNPELPPTISFSYQNSPRAIMDPNGGYFYFDNIEPAQNYIITVLYGPGEFVDVEEENSDMPLMISVSGGDLLNLGVLSIDMP